ncbi:hypothetical protein OHA21_07925 [Actinoplanes sp. NBC_00393]|uniref:hypothetical protein n=1 Tax=Actinoplanes sp. NBC_00393 TaxID=2975953 RepID=UPI002E1DF2EF
MHYYVTSAPDGLVAEEFVRDADYVTLGLRGAVWSTDSPRWRSSASFCWGLRHDPDLRSRVTPADRDTAEDAFHRFGGGELPGEDALRAGFLEYEAIAAAPPLRLGAPVVPGGFHERRHYRVLFAGDGPATLPADDRTTGSDHFSWELRRVGRDIAWALDVTALLATANGNTVGPVIDELIATLHRQGLMPVTTERFA